MSAGTEKMETSTTRKITVSEVLFGTLLAFGAISGIWLSSTFLMHILEKL